MTRSLVCAGTRYAGVLVWVPLLVLGPLLTLGEGVGQVTFRLVLVVVMVAAAVVAVLGTDPVQQRRTSYVALGVLVAAVVAGSTQGERWLAPCILVVLVTPVVLRGSIAWYAIPVVAAYAMTVSWLDGDRGTALWTTVGSVLLAGVATTSFIRLTETVEELRRTRTELARVAVLEERERFSRDLHDLLGHTLSVMVVKAEAVRRLAARDPEAAAAHAADIEQVGRQALVDVRQAVDAMRAPTLADELVGAQRGLEAAGIRAVVPSVDPEVTPAVDEALAWVVREGVTNVLRHAAARTCRIELNEAGTDVRLLITDDGVGAQGEAGGRRGGLDGLRQRLAAVGGVLDLEPGPRGFRLVATVPSGAAVPGSSTRPAEVVGT